MIVGVPKESFPGERRVALVPAVIPNLVKIGLEVVVEAGAGVEAGYPDAQYAEKGAKILPDRKSVFGTADIVTQVLCYGSNDKTGKADLPLMRRSISAACSEAPRTSVSMNLSGDAGGDCSSSDGVGSSEASVS